MKQDKFTYAQITSTFLEFENGNQLLDLKLKDVYIWEVCRTDIFFMLVDHFISGNVAIEKKSKWVLIKNTLYRIFVNSLFFNPLYDRKEKKVLIFESGRKYGNQDSQIDIYTNYLDQQLKEKNISFTRYETNYNTDAPFFKRNFEVKHLDYIQLLSKLRSEKMTPFNLEEQNKITEIKQGIYDCFGIDLALETIFESNIAKFKKEFSLFKILFKNKKCKEIFVVNSCDKPALIAAAKEQNCIVNELQHGLNSDQDIVLNFPLTKVGSLHYFPDYFHQWNNVEMFFAKLPIAKENVKYFENENIAYWLEKTKSLKKIPNTILVISQPYGSTEIFQFMKNNSTEMPNYSFIYKVHPVENFEIFSDFLSNNPTIKNIRFVQNEESLYELMKKSTLVLGIYSSALFEAVAFDCKVILLNLPGVEMSLSLLSNQRNKIINVGDKLSDLVIQNNHK